MIDCYEDAWSYDVRTKLLCTVSPRKTFSPLRSKATELPYETVLACRLVFGSPKRHYECR